MKADRAQGGMGKGMKMIIQKRTEEKEKKGQEKKKISSHWGEEGFWVWVGGRAEATVCSKPAIFSISLGPMKNLLQFD